jgi:osmoprotectant transport system ATP-binding protein
MATASAEPMIRLDHLTKRFPGQQEIAVDDLSMDIGAGEQVMLVGPSGCGKTTTLRLINRLIEPSGGHIYLEGEDVTDVDPDHLRRRIGYVIQQVGLFPHLSIAANIAVTPKLLGWPKPRIAARVDELLHLVGMEPASYRDRYPKQLSGGQKQRIGVARALAADPPVMLMDEPFGAIDPITRERLQDEFLGLQEQVRKTVVFVTHDIQEAIKMGTQVALFREHGHLEQYASPAELLAHPATEFVADFVGPGSSVRLLGLAPIGAAALDSVRVARGPSAAPEGDAGRLPSRVLELDESGHPRRWLVDSGGDSRDVVTLRSRQSLYDALDLMLRGRDTVAVVLDDDGRYTGVVHLDALSSSMPDGARRDNEMA